MGLTHICSGKCYKCTEKQLGPDWREKSAPVIRTFHLVRALSSRGARKPSEVIDCWECQECKTLVPADSWHTYQETGDVIVRHSTETRRKR